MKYIDIEKFDGFNAEIDYSKIIDKYANKAKNRLKTKSPNGNRKTNKYKDTWVVVTEKNKNEYSAIVKNEKNWQLTHLLENGHQIVNKKGGVGWASAKPHIKPTFDELKSKFINAMANETKIKINAK